MKTQNQKNQKLIQPHDFLFKNIMTRKDALEVFIRVKYPNLSKIIDFDKIEFIKTDFLGKDLKESYADVICKTYIKGREIFILLLLEHKSQPDKFTFLQVLEYTVRLYQHYKTSKQLPLVISFVFYHGKKVDWNLPKLKDLIKVEDESLLDYIPDFKINFVNINKLNDDEIFEFKESLALLGMFGLFRAIFKDVEEIIKFLRKMQNYYGKQLLEKTNVELYELFWQYLMNFRKFAKDENVKQELMEVMTPVAYEIGSFRHQLVMEYEKGLKEGIQKGLQEGIQKGIQKGLQEGIQKGLQEGIQKGIQKGLQEGIQKGLQEGIQKGLIKAVRALRKLGLSDDQIIAELEIDKQTYQKILQILARQK